jgi:hypothetical protein
MKFPRGPSLGFLGLFGRSADLRQLDDAFRSIDVHPRLVPEAVKLTMVNLIKNQHGTPPPPAYFAAAEIVGYCMIGPEAYGGANGEERLAAVERRLEAALLAGSNLDAQLVLLALHAKIVQPAVRDAFDLESASI